MDERVRKILELISELYGDTSVPASTTREWMEEIGSDVDAKLDALLEE